MTSRTAWISSLVTLWVFAVALPWIGFSRWLLHVNFLGATFLTAAEKTEVLVWCSIGLISCLTAIVAGIVVVRRSPRAWPKAVAWSAIGLGTLGMLFWSWAITPAWNYPVI